MVLKFILIGGVLPGFVCTVALLAAMILSRRADAPRVPAWLVPLLVALSILPAYRLAQESWPPLAELPTNAFDRIPHVVFAAGLFGILTACIAALVARSRSSTARGCAESRPALIATVLTSVPVSAACLWISLSHRYPASWKTPLVAALWMIGYTALCWAMVMVLELAARRRPKIDTREPSPRDPAPVLVLFIAANALPIIILKSGNAFLSQLTGGIVAALGAALVASIILPRFTLARGGFTTLVAALVPISLVGMYLSAAGTPEPRLPMILVAAAVLIPSVLLATLYRSATAVRRATVAGIIAVVLAGSAMIAHQVQLSSSKSSAPSGSADDYFNPS